MLINDLVPGVLRKLGNRTDVTPFVPFWIKDAVIELTESYPFEELKVTGPLLQFKTNVFEYPITYFTNNNEIPTIINSWYVSYSTTLPVPGATNNNNTGRYLKFRTIPVLDVMSKISGVPSKWTRNGKNFIVGQAPNAAYATQMRYQREHPFLCSLFDASGLLTQTIQMPASWSIIVEFEAAMIGAYENRMLDYAKMYHDVLYGDPEFQETGRGNPGLIFSRTSNYDRDGSMNERQLQMVVMKSCGG
jgi:hypothetical protein